MYCELISVLLAKRKNPHHHHCQFEINATQLPGESAEETIRSNLRLRTKDQAWTCGKVEGSGTEERMFRSVRTRLYTLPLRVRPKIHTCFRRDLLWPCKARWNYKPYMLYDAVDGCMTTVFYGAGPYRILYRTPWCFRLRRYRYGSHHTGAVEPSIW